MAEGFFETPVAVRFKDLDAMGHVNNAVFATYFEEARATFAREAMGLATVDGIVKMSDVSDAAAVKKFVAAVAEKFGGVDVCVTNAAGPPSRNFFTATNEEWRQAFDIYGVPYDYIDPETVKKTANLRAKLSMTRGQSRKLTSKKKKPI